MVSGALELADSSLVTGCHVTKRAPILLNAVILVLQVSKSAISTD